MVVMVVVVVVVVVISQTIHYNETYMLNLNTSWGLIALSSNNPLTPSRV
jgi:hypothetical protein